MRGRGCKFLDALHCQHTQPDRTAQLRQRHDRRHDNHAHTKHGVSMPGRPRVALAVDDDALPVHQRTTQPDDQGFEVRRETRCTAAPHDELITDREGFNVGSDSVPVPKLRYSHTLVAAQYMCTTCRVSKSCGPVKRAPHVLADCVVEPTRTRLARLQLVASPMCLYMIAARVSKPCGVVRAHRTHHLPAAYPPAQCSSLPWRRRVRKGARTLSAPEPHAPHAENSPHDRMSMAR